MFSFLSSGRTGPSADIADIIQSAAAGKIQLIDVREVAEAKASGIAEGAKVLPLSLLPLKADPRQPDCELPKGVPVAVYCASGARSAAAADLLKRLGHDQVVNLGGLRDWAMGGGRVVPF